MDLKRILLLTLLVPLISISPLSAQTYPTDFFRSPLDIPISFSGTFGEIRANHFHSGIDLRTCGAIGQPVHAAADGYVSRINISPWGGGKVLYIDHPNGYRTVYMHLNDFCGEIGEWVRQYQYDHHTYAFDQNLPQGLIKVRKGDIVAHSGNSGASGGPHLHFEIRHSKNDRTINPLYFGLKYVDNIAPTIRGIRLYPTDSLPIEVGANDSTITVNGPFYAGIYATDAAEQSTPKNGIDRIELMVDGSLFWQYRLESYLFEETRAVNTLIDYPLYCSSRQAFLVTHVIKGSPFNPARNTYVSHQLDQLGAESQSHPLLSDSDGILAFEAGTTHRLDYRVYDHHNNVATRTLWVTAGKAATSNGLNPFSSYSPTHFYEPIVTKTSRYSVSIKANTLYDDDMVVIQETHPETKTALPFGVRVSTKKQKLPPHKPFELKIFIPKNYRHLHRLTIVNIVGKKMTACTTKRTGDTLTANPRFWGHYAVVQDTTPPKITTTNPKPKKAFPKIINIKISDNLSGIESYHCYVDGEWILAEFDGKTNTLSIDTKESPKLKKGCTLKVVVTDACGNKSQKIIKY